jgi:hypothetical protein
LVRFTATSRRITEAPPRPIGRRGRIPNRPRRLELATVPLWSRLDASPFWIIMLLSSNVGSRLSRGLQSSGTRESRLIIRVRRGRPRARGIPEIQQIAAQSTRLSSCLYWLHPVKLTGNGSIVQPAWPLKLICAVARNCWPPRRSDPAVAFGMHCCSHDESGLTRRQGLRGKTGSAPLHRSIAWHHLQSESSVSRRRLNRRPYERRGAYAKEWAQACVGTWKTWPRRECLLLF